MKSVTIVFGLLASTVLASPVAHDGGLVSIRNTEEVDDLGLPQEDMAFEGPIFPDGPVVTLHGTAQSIYEQILVLNPKYDPWDFPDYATDMEAAGLTRATYNERFATSPVRRGVLEARQGSIDCGKGRMVYNISSCIEGIDYLTRLGSARCGSNARTCARISCSNGCGMFFCNTSSGHHWRPCGNMVKNFDDIARECGQTWSSTNGWYSVTNARGRQTFQMFYNELSAQSC